jgi:hypothetical protein
VDRFAVARAAVERFAVELLARDAALREPVERDVVERPVLREPLRFVPEFVRDAREVVEAVADDSVWRSLSKSLSACLLALPASRRSERSAVVTSL